MYVCVCGFVCECVCVFVEGGGGGGGVYHAGNVPLGLLRNGIHPVLAKSEMNPISPKSNNRYSSFCVRETKVLL